MQRRSAADAQLAQLERLQNENRGLREDCRQYDHAVQRLRADKANLRDEVASLTRERDRLYAENVDLGRRLVRLQDATTDGWNARPLVEVNHALRSTIASLRGEIAALKLQLRRDTPSSNDLVSLEGRVSRIERRLDQAWL